MFIKAEGIEYKLKDKSYEYIRQEKRKMLKQRCHFCCFKPCFDSLKGQNVNLGKQGGKVSASIKDEIEITTFFKPFQHKTILSIKKRIYQLKQNNFYRVKY